MHGICFEYKIHSWFVSLFYINDIGSTGSRGHTCVDMCKHMKTHTHTHKRERERERERDLFGTMSIDFDGPVSDRVYPLVHREMCTNVRTRHFCTVQVYMLGGWTSAASIGCVRCVCVSDRVYTRVHSAYTHWNVDIRTSQACVPVSLYRLD